MVRSGGAEKRYRHDLRSVADLSARASELVGALKKTRRPVILTEDGVPAGVLLDVASYAELRETALLMEVAALGRRDGGRPPAPRRRGGRRPRP